MTLFGRLARLLGRSTPPGNFVDVCSADSLSTRIGKRVSAGGREIAVFQVGRGACAITNTCPHKGASLADGRLDGDEVVCPWHSWRFSVKTGAGNRGHAVEVFPVRIEGGRVLVSVPRPTPAAAPRRP